MKNRRYWTRTLLISLALLLAWGVERSLARSRRAQLCAQEYEPPPPGMVFVPAGEFLMGSNDPNAEPDEWPLRKVFVPAFYVDRFEVTNRRYQEFKPDHRFPPGDEDLPVTFVLKREAEAFCHWAGRRLPSGAEWEKAARGTDGRTYPWGNEFAAGLANIDRRAGPSSTNAANCQQPITGHSTGKLPGGSFPQGASPFGCHDMAGNVWEWVSDVWRDKGVPGAAAESRGILRGGAYGYSARQARTSYQGFEALEATCHDVGFRCALTVVAKRQQ